MSSYILHSEINSLLAVLRARRGFDAQKYIDAKSRLLNDYMKRSGLKSVVLGVSGGIDSALVLGLVTHASKQPGSPIKRVVAALLPYFISEGTSNQEEATAKGREVAAAFAADCALVDLSSGHAAIKLVADKAMNTHGGAWASGQLVSYLRTPALFYLASLLNQERLPAIVTGTTNRDEGAYIGFFGKAGDAMVDLQLISDVHKSEVYAVSRLLGVPESVLTAVPAGDIYDGRNDEQLIGAPYDMIELFSLYLVLDAKEQARLRATLGAEALSQFDHFADRLRTLNRENAHKYVGGSTSVHLDVYERAVPGGWRLELDPEHVQAKLDRSVFVNEFVIAPKVIEELETPAPNSVAAPSVRSELADFGDSAFMMNSVMSGDECDALLAEMKKLEEPGKKGWLPVGRNGMVKGFDAAKDVIGSYRASYFSEAFAGKLWDRIAPSFPTLRVMGEDTPADWNGDPVWRAVGINPLMRFIRYTENGLLVPHYDAPFDYHDGKRTLMSLVLYLTEGDSKDGGATRFILDPQRHLPLGERDYSDWDRLAVDREVLLPVQPKLGSALIFDHRILHDSERIRSDATKIIMRTDIVFERCGLPSKTQVTVSKPLGLPETSVTTEQAVESTGSAATAPENDPAVMARMLQDPYYGSAYQALGSMQSMIEAGYFDENAGAEGAPTRPGLDWLMTPTRKIEQRLKALAAASVSGEQKLTVLLSTGSFCPIHEGHIEMMEIARKELEAQGAIVLGGYLSPSHDGYVSVKLGDEALSGAHRLRLVEESIRDSDWLMADGWEALGAEKPLNFTDVIIRLEEYLSTHVRTHRPIHVVYVFGSDNAKFARTFIARGHCVCISRPGSEQEFEAVANEDGLRHNARVVFARTKGIDAASRVVRKGGDSVMRSGAREMFLDWMASPRTGAELRKGLYHLRNEGDWTISPWFTGRDADAVRKSFSTFQEGLIQLLKRVHREATFPDMPLNIEVQVRGLEEQRRLAASIAEKDSVISMDPCIDGNFNLAVSRHFAIAAGRFNPEVGERPGFPSLQEQMRSIPAGDYVLVDDDIATGTTMRKVQSLLPATVKVKQSFSLTPCQYGDKELPYDVVDCRDFLVGSREAGLVVRLPNGALARAPYSLPYVSAHDRAMVPLSHEFAFSQALWCLNKEFFASFSVPVTLADTSAAFQTLMQYVGFSSTTPMVEICDWHARQLKDLIPKS